ncbi:hypothetical protein, partial [Nocardiopsis tropica]|uniref:hypothetical protein n=1 Tax=Nocardiopsis tropica TaxID=109330 RepID=UPI0031DA12E8
RSGRRPRPRGLRYRADSGTRPRQRARERCRAEEGARMDSVGEVLLVVLVVAVVGVVPLVVMGAGMVREMRDGSGPGGGHRGGGEGESGGGDGGGGGC